MKKRFLALLLTFVIALALLPASALAEDSDFVVVDGVLEKYNGPGGAVVIPDGVYWIKKEAFQDNPSIITSLVIPEGVVAIGGTLSRRPNLRGDGWLYTFSSYSTSWGTFQGRGLKEVTLPSTLEYIADNTFAYNSTLETVRFPAECESLSIGYSAFEECKSLKTISLPKNTSEYLTGGGIKIDTAAFSCCRSLETVRFAPGGEYHLGVNSFSGCKELKTLENAEGIKTFHETSFSGCTKIENMTLSDELDPTLLVLFADTPWFQKQYGSQEFMVENGALVKYNGPGGSVVIPDNLGITAISKAGFDNVTSIVIPEGVTRIADEAFNSCKKLKQVTLPASLKYIGNGAFALCEQLDNVVLPENVVMGNGAFGGCPKLTHVTIPDTVVTYCSKDGKDLLTSFGGTPFEKALLDSQKDDEFVMIGATLVKYQGPGGKVVLPAHTRLIGNYILNGNDTITSITYPPAAKKWLDERWANSVDEGEATLLQLYGGYWKSWYFADCHRLVDFVNAPVEKESEFLWEDFQAARAWYVCPVDPADCLGTPSIQIVEKSNAIVSAAGALTNYDKARAIADWVAKNVKYDLDIANKTKSAYDAVVDPDQILKGAATTCDGYTGLTNQLLWAQGIPANHISGRARNENHAWTEAWIEEEGRWVIIDTTWMAPLVTGTQTQSYDPEWFDASILRLCWDHSITSRPYAEPEKPATAEELGLTVTGWAKADVDKALAAGLYDEALGKDMTVGITRAQAAVVAVKLYEAMNGASMPIKDNPFTDTEDPNVIKAYSLGLIDGNGTGLFTPDAPLNREAVAVMLAKVYRKLGGTIPAASAMKFADSAKISGWAKAEVSFMEGEGIVKGNGTNFNPQGPITGQEALILGLKMMNTLG